MSVGLAVVTSECHVQRSEYGNSTEGFEAGLNGSQLRVSGSVSALDLRGEGSSRLGRPRFAGSFALFNGLNHTGGAEASKSEEELLHLFLNTR